MYAHTFSHFFHILLLFHPLHLWQFGSLYCCGYHFIIPLVTGKNKYQINVLMKKVSYDKI